jgi:hypothetical protein
MLELFSVFPFILKSGRGQNQRWGVFTCARYDRAKKLTVGEMIHFSGDFGEDNANPGRGLGV